MISSATWPVFIAALMLSMMWQNHSIRKITRETIAVDKELLAHSKETAARNALALGEIHTLVNSNLSKSQQAELDATRRDLTSLEELVDLKRSQNLRVSDESLTIIEQVKDRINELSKELDHRGSQTELADKGRHSND
jgi:hypothetical protein